MANRYLIKVDDVLQKEIKLEADLTGIAPGAHVVKVESYQDATLLDTKTRNVTVMSTISYQPETTAFMNATSTPDDSSASIYTGLTNHDCWVLLNDVITYYKDNGVWSDILHWHPAFGGTAVKHSYNVKDVNAFQKTWFGSWVHNANGNVGNGANTYASFGFIPNTHFESWDNIGMTIVSTGGGNGIELGSRNSSTSRTYMAFCLNQQVYHFIGGFSGNTANALDTGVFTNKKVGATISTIRNKNTPLFTSSDPSTAVSTAESYYGAYNESGTAASISGKTLADVLQHNGVADTNIIQEGLRMWNVGLGRLTDF